MSEPECICDPVADDPECPSCYPDNDRVIRQHRVAKVLLAGDTHHEMGHDFPRHKPVVDPSNPQKG